MPKKATVKKKKKPVKVNKMNCVECQSEKAETMFYKSNSKFFDRLPICKQCIKNKIDLDDMRTVYDLFKQMDLPFLIDVWESAENAKGETFGAYMRMINSLHQYDGMGWENSIMEVDRKIVEEELDMTNFQKERLDNEKWDYKYLKEKWGDYENKRELRLFEKKYNMLKDNYPEKTAMHTEALLNYCRYRVKEEMATLEGNVSEAKAWGALAKDAASAAKINPSQLTKADLSDGMSTFSELAESVESEVNIIRILPKFRYQPNDALDFNIWCYVNYIRNLQGYDLVPYEDIYRFYDNRKENYIKETGDPYGIFEDDPMQENRKRIELFIKGEDGA